MLITRLISEELLLVDTKRQMTTDDRILTLAMFYRAAILDLEAKAATGTIQ